MIMITSSTTTKTLKCAVRDCVQSSHCSANYLQHARSSDQGAVVCKSRATHRAPVTCNMCATHVQHTARLLRATCVQITCNTPRACYVQHVCKITCNTPGAYYVQHVCKSRATHQAPITCNMYATWYPGTAQLFSLTELKSPSLSFYFID